MKLNKLAVLALAVAALAGCKNEDISRQHYDNKLYIKTSTFAEEMLIQPANESYSRSLVVGTAQPVERDVEVTFAVAPELLETYKAAYYDELAVLLPEANYSLAEPATLISAGGVESMPVAIEFLAINTLDREGRYVLPVKIASVEGIDVLESATACYFVFKGAALINVVANMKENRAWPSWKDGSIVDNLSNFTLEALINGTTLTKQISTVMGIEGNFLIRLGDAGVDPDQIQVASTNNLTSPDLKIETGRWYHLAVAFDNGDVTVYLDGEAKCTGNVGKTAVSFGAVHSEEPEGMPRCFWVGYSYAADRYFDGLIAEARIWNRTLTADEINGPDHFYGVDPASEGLVAYWKFDDGMGTSVRDHSASGNDLTFQKEPAWVAVSLPESNK